MHIIVNAAMQAERQHDLRAVPYGCTDARQGYANGYKPKTLTTRIGQVPFAVPQVRDGSLDPSTFAFPAAYRQWLCTTSCTRCSNQ